MTRRHAFGDHLNLSELDNGSVDPTKTQTFGRDNAQRLSSAAPSAAYGSRTSTFTYPTASNLPTNVKRGSTVMRAFA